MGKHAQTRPPSRARRVAVVSTGTLLLCLCGAGPAFADIGPVPVPEPVDDAVATVTHAAGIDDPIADSTGSTDSDKTTKHARHKHHSKTTLTKSKLTASTTTTKATSTRTTDRTAAQHRSAPAPTSYAISGLRAAPMTATTPSFATGRAPVTAGALPAAGQATAAGQTPQLITPAANILDGTGGEDGPRVLLVGLAAMVLGGLSAGHIKVAQDRIAAIIG
jgi:hypothetical protein